MPKLRCPNCHSATLKLEATAFSDVRGTTDDPSFLMKSTSYTVSCPKGDFTIKRVDFSKLLTELRAKM